MESEANQETFGSYLKNVRLKREMAIETVAARTKIAVHCLQEMEDNAHDRLPPRAYVKSFIRAYADAVGANADIALNLYMADLELQAAARQQFLKRQAKLSSIRRLLMVGGGITAIVLVLRYTDFLPDAEPPRATVAEQSPLAATPAVENPPVDTGAAADKQPEKLKLRVVAVERTWLKVIVDGQNARSYELKPEERLELEGADSFNLMIGDANNLEIYLNERPVKIFGSRGQVVSLKIP